MTITRTTLLDLPIITSGTETGVWGDITNNGLTQYLDIAIAGMVSLTSSDFTAGALTIALTEGTSGATNIANSSAQYATIKVSSLATNSTITAPASNRSYRIVNADSTYNLTIKASGQTGITFLPGQTGVVAFTGTDYEVVGVVNAASSTDNAVPKFDGTTGQIIQNTGVTIDDSNNVSGVAQLNATTVDTTNIEVTNIKAKDGTAAGSIADSTGVVTLASSVLTTTDINGGTIDGTAIGGSTPAAGSFTTLNTSGAVVFNDAGADVDFRVEGDTDANLLFVDASTDRVGVGTNAPVTNFTVGNGSGNNLGVLLSRGASTNFYEAHDGTKTMIAGVDSSQDFIKIGSLSNHSVGFITNNNERMRIDSSGRVLIGGTTTYDFNGQSNLVVNGTANNSTITIASTSDGYLAFADGTTGAQAYAGRISYYHASNYMDFWTNGTERMRIDSSGNLLVGTTTGTNSVVQKSVTENGGEGVFTVSSQTGFNIIVLGTTGTGYSVANTTILVKKDTGTNRSINAAGTVNASGTDYAEYMTKAGEFELAKGDVCGVNPDGKLTNVFADAVAFVVKSTNPSYVGGDTWGNDKAIGLRPVTPTQQAAEVDEEGNETQAAETDEDFAARQAQYETDLAEFEAKLEAERQKVDRIAFSGQVPVNVIGATAGQYIVPVENNGGITGIPVNEADMTLAQYMKAVGKVIAIEEDGRARIIVKVA